MSERNTTTVFLKKKILYAVLFLCLFPLNAHADEVLGNEMDLHGILETGGLALKQFENVEILSQELYVSKNKIEINYVFQNNSDKDITTVVAFPLPVVVTDPSAGDFEVKIEETGANAKKSFIDFDISVEGKKLIPHVIKGGFSRSDIEKPIFFLPDNATADLDKENNIQVTYYWQQTFPVNIPIHAKLVYKPITGFNVIFETESVKEIDFYYDETCMKDIVPAFVKKIEKNDPSNIVGLSSIGYVFSTQANWAGGIIGDFRLIVDKEKSENLISLCGENIKKISPTQFEMRAKNYKPSKDLFVTIISD